MERITEDVYGKEDLNVKCSGRAVSGPEAQA